MGDMADFVNDGHMDEEETWLESIFRHMHLQEKLDKGLLDENGDVQ